MMQLHEISINKTSKAANLHEYEEEVRNWLNEEKAEGRENEYPVETTLIDICKLHDIPLTEEEIEESTRKATNKIVKIVSHRIAWQDNEGRDVIREEKERVAEEEKEREKKAHRERISQACQNPEAKELYDKGERDILKIGKHCTTGAFWIGKWDLENDPIARAEMHKYFPEAR